MRTIIFLALLLSACQTPPKTTLQLPKPIVEIQSGPMLGYSEMREVLIWVQTQSAATVHARYRLRGSTGDYLTTDPVVASKETFYAVKLIADQVEPGKRYEYDIVINGQVMKRDYPTEFITQPLFQWREKANPPVFPPDITFAFGSCMYVNETVYDRPGTPYGRNFQVLTYLNQKKPDFMVWLGDNTYLREVDWHSRTGIFKRYTNDRSLPELQPLLARTHHYATWDDHDYGPNDSDRGFYLKHQALDAFRAFWGNTGFGRADQDGVYSYFQWGDIDFWLLDDRWFRAPNRLKGADREYFGQRQIQWLKDGLVNSRAPFKFVCAGNQIINNLKIFENYANYEAERANLLSFISEQKIDGVVFLTGDIHHAEVNKLDRPGAYPLYDLTSSPLTAGVYSGQKRDGHKTLVEGSFVDDNNYAIVRITGKRNDRKLVYEVYNSKNEKAYTLTIHENDLKFKED